MRYLLIFSFIYRHYRKKMNVRLYSDNYLLDDIYLDKEIYTKRVNKTKISAKYKNIKEFKWWYAHRLEQTNVVDYQDKPEQIHVYEIDDSVLAEQVRIEIEDYSANSTNGFMTKSNTLMIDSIFLFPKCLFESHESLHKLGNLIYKNPRLVEQNRPNAKPDDIYNDHIIEWPGNGVTIEQGQVNVNTWHGGVKTLTIPVSKKHNIYFLDPCRKNRVNGRPAKWGFNTGILEYDEIFRILPENTHEITGTIGKLKILSL